MFSVHRFQHARNERHRIRAVVETVSKLCRDVCCHGDGLKGSSRRDGVRKSRYRCLFLEISAGHSLQCLARGVSRLSSHLLLLLLGLIARYLFIQNSHLVFGFHRLRGARTGAPAAGHCAAMVLNLKITFHAGDYVRERGSPIAGRIVRPGQAEGEWVVALTSGQQIGCLGIHLILLQKGRVEAPVRRAGLKVHPGSQRQELSLQQKYL